MLRIDFSPPSRSKCDCCGGVTTKLTRFITVDQEARGVYFASFSDNHPDPHVVVLLSLGEWWDGTGPEVRVAFAFRIWLSGDDFQVGVIDASEAGWADAALMGRRLTREEALGRPELQEVFGISDRIVEEDEPIRSYFEQVRERAAQSN